MIQPANNATTKFVLKVFFLSTLMGPFFQPGIGTYFQPGVVSRLFTLGAQLLDNAIAWFVYFSPFHRTLV